MSAFLTAGLLAAFAASPVSAFWRLPCKSPIVVERADPIVSPGQVSNHLHTIMGGNGFDFTMTYNSTQASTCSSCTVTGDNSNYWIPALFFQHQNGTFESVDQIGGATVYYLQRAGDNETLKAFPPGFRMVAGDPFKRSAGTDFASQAVSYACLNYNGPATAETPMFPDYNCPDGLRSQVFFPSCWNGKDLDSADHKSHMSYPATSYNSGGCPSDFPVHLVSIFYEVIWDTNKFADLWYGNSQPFVWSMGDPTGYGHHGDFVNGWEDTDLLQNAIDQCTAESGNVEDCPLFKLIPDAQAEGCKIEPEVDEQVSGFMSALPGCNPVQSGPAEATVKTGCGATTTISPSNATFFTDLTSQGWSYTGCGTDNYSNRILTGASESNSNMTNEVCIAFCESKGFTVAGTEYSDECYCGNSIPSSGMPLAGVVGNCQMTCAGESSDFCGGSAAISLYQKCTSSSNCTNAQFGVSASGSAAVVSSAAASTASSSNATLLTAASSTTMAASPTTLTTVTTSNSSATTSSAPQTVVQAVSTTSVTTSSSPTSSCDTPELDPASPTSDSTSGGSDDDEAISC
ncbi:WSC domain-containing protein [Exophiala viscosa]|uniref:WSC domain-containing protein n=1 Tax=Exophiala viscosa TaxID=2486360 RepID=A0AAN6ID93_9EURO|nr:WSC domain-containing protein [Exophiala viscosa]KAI1626312.1 WSC domain-containing protein [Exophiala viscosa]